MRKLKIHVSLPGLFLLLSLAFLSGCEGENGKQQPPENEIKKSSEENLPPAIVSSPAEIDFDKMPFKRLSEYGFFAGELNQLKPNEGVLLYEPVSTLFTDYAHKSRFIWMPNGLSATIIDGTPWEFDFPDKTILVKNFYYPADFKKPEAQRRVVETRLLIKYKGQWEAWPYLWNENQKDAALKVTGATTEVKFTDEIGETHTINYIQPNKNQCKSCHNQNEVLLPIGPKVRNLNFELDYAAKGNDAASGKHNQLEKWAEVGYLVGFKGKTAYPAMVDYNNTEASLSDRAKAYLDSNCGHCHRENSPASTSGLFLTWEEKDPVKYGLKKTPVAAGIGAGPLTYDLVPGKASESIIVYRMNSTEPAVMMAELGRVMIHKEGVALISDWINQMK